MVLLYMCLILPQTGLGMFSWRAEVQECFLKPQLCLTYKHLIGHRWSHDKPRVKGQISLHPGKDTQQSDMAEGMNTGRGKGCSQSHSQCPGIPLQGACQAAGLMDHQGVPQAQDRNGQNSPPSFLKILFGLWLHSQVVSLSHYIPAPGEHCW